MNYPPGTHQGHCDPKELKCVECGKILEDCAYEERPLCEGCEETV